MRGYSQGNSLAADTRRASATQTSKCDLSFSFGDPVQCPQLSPSGCIFSRYRDWAKLIERVMCQLGTNGVDLAPVSPDSQAVAV